MAVAVKTHAAVSIVLDSVAQRLHELLARNSQEERLDLFRHVRLAKVYNNMDEAVPAGVEVLLADGDDQPQRPCTMARAVGRALRRCRGRAG